MSAYDDMTREQLEVRLAAAERVCVVFGWTAATNTEASKACHELWREWLRISGVPTGPRHNTELHDMVPVLAAMRDAQRAETLRRLPREDDE